MSEWVCAVGLEAGWECRIPSPLPLPGHRRTQVDGSERFSKLVEFLRKKLGRDTVFLYLRESFSPSLDERVSTLHDAFGVGGRLVVNYALTPAWG